MTTAPPKPNHGKLFQPQVCVVDFHHVRGPEVEFWVSEEGRRLHARNEWSLLPFMAMSDGSHARTEEYSWFTLLDRGPSESEGGDGGDDDDDDDDRAKVGETTTTLFGIACTRQVRSDSLKNRSADVTRSSVQKSVVVVVGDARGLGELKTRLGFVTETWFGQRDFTDIDILKAFQDSLIKVASEDNVEDGETYFGLSLREVIHDFRHQTLVLVKALILQRKILFFGSSCEQVCLLQFALVSLIPGLMAHLEDCAHPDLEMPAESRGEEPRPPNPSSRAELLSFVGQPLRIFGKGSVFMPYAPLQHLDLLADYDTKSYVVGSTNSLLLQQKEHYADLLVNMDEQNSISIVSPSLRQALQLSAADRRWIDALTDKVMETWDERNPSQPKGMGYQGSEGAIRLAFEEYILSLCSCMAYQKYRESGGGEGVEEKENGPASSFEKISRAVKARRSAEREGVRAEFDESALPQGEDDDEDEAGNAPRTPPRSPGRSPSRSHNETNTTTTNTTPITMTTTTTTTTTIISSPPRKIDLVAQTYDPAENTVDFSAPFLAAWQETANCRQFLARVQGRRIFDVVEPRHPTAGGFSMDDLNRRLAQNLGDLRKQYHVDERYALARGRAGEALQAGRERWGRWWSELDEQRRARSRNKENAAATVGNNDTVSSAHGDDADSVSGGAGWSAAIRERAAAVDAEAVQRAARESAAKAGAYLSSWGTWARQRGSEWQQGKEESKG